MQKYPLIPNSFCIQQYNLIFKLFFIKKVVAITVYIGIDDSNHAGTAKGEVIAAGFSFLPEDRIVRQWPNKRQAGIEKIMQSE